MTRGWAGQPHWRILALGAASVSRFIATGQAWKDDPQRPRMLHFVAIAEAAPPLAELSGAAQPLPRELARQCYGLLPGVHRLVFEGGQVLLTLCVGDTGKQLRQLEFHADAVVLAAADVNLKSLARCCRRGTMIEAADGDGELAAALQRHGFVLERGSGPTRLRGAFSPAWEPRGPIRNRETVAGDCVVIGAGLAGAAAASSMARRGWKVVVLDAAASPAAGASGLPAGLLVPHSSPDDSLLSRLTRDGVRATLQQAHALLAIGSDWEPSGVLEHRVDGVARRADPASDAAAEWTRPADAQQKRAAGIGEEAAADWHGQAGWLRPASLVDAWLAQRGVQVRCGAKVARLVRTAQGWQAEDASGAVLASGKLVIVAAALGSGALVEGLTLQAVRGQVSWAAPSQALRLPPFAVNGDGGFIPSIPTAEGPAWLCGSTYQRDAFDLSPRKAEHQENLERLRRILPAVAAQLDGAFERGEVGGWTGIRCASTDRRPLVGRLEGADNEGLYVSTAMGSRGLTFAALAGELIAAQVHAEPLPLARKLAQALAPARHRNRSSPGLQDRRPHPQESLASTGE